MKRFVFPAILLFPLFAVSLLAQDKLLPPTFQAGREYTVRHTLNTESMLGGAKQTVDISFDMQSKCQRAKGRDGQRMVTSVISRLNANMKLGNVTMSYDSEKASSDKDLLGQTFSKLINQPFKVYFDATDEIVEIEKIEDLPENNPLSQLFGPEQLKKLVAPQMSFGIPAEGITTGTKWKNQDENKVGPGMNVTTDYQMAYTKDAEVDGENCAVLTFDGTMDLDLTSQGGDADPKVPMRVKSGKTKGTASIDKKLRFLRQGSVELDLTMEIPNPQNPEAALELPVKQKIGSKLIQVKRLGLF